MLSYVGTMSELIIVNTGTVASKHIESFLCIVLKACMAKW